MVIYGWDGSDFDLGRGPVNVEAMVRDLGDPCFVTHKSTEGTRVRHTNFGNVIRRARAAGATFTGAYVVPRTPGNGGNGSIAAQVDYLTAYLDQQIPGWRGWNNFFVQVDLEHWSGPSGVYDAVAPRHGVDMANLIEQRTGKKTILYAPQWAYGNTIPGAHPLWASAYGNNPAGHFRAAYPGDNSSRWAAYSGRTPAILQYGSRLTIGNQPGCDANAYRGSLDELRALITGGNMAGEADKAFSAPYTGNEPWISGQSWAAKAIERPLRKANEQLDGLATAVQGLSGAQAAAVAPTQAQVDAAILKALQDPAVLKGIGDAIAAHLHVS